MSQIKLQEHPDYITLLLPKNHKVLSSAILNGGLSDTASFLNLKVDKDSSATISPQITLATKAKELALPQPTTAMMTAASMKSLGYAIESSGKLSVKCWVTSGLSNVRRIGDTSDESKSIGTINIWLYINQTLSDSALAEALIILTESKVTVIRDKGILSPISNLPASGTGTDSHAVFCPYGDEKLEYCGKHTLLGELIGRAVINACTISLDKSMSFN